MKSITNSYHLNHSRVFSLQVPGGFISSEQNGQNGSRVFSLHVGWKFPGAHRPALDDTSIHQLVRMVSPLDDYSSDESIFDHKM